MVLPVARRAFFLRGGQSHSLIRPSFTQLRLYAAIPSRAQEPVPTFQPTSSKKLDDLLDEFRRRLFIPKSLPRRYRPLIFKASKAEYIKQHPVVVTVYNDRPDTEPEEKFTLEPLHNKLIPGLKKVREVLRCLKTPEDWRVVIPFLTGLQSSGLRLRSDEFAKIIRAVGNSGKSALALDIAKQGARTGVSLRDIETAKSLFEAIRIEAANAEFRGEEVATSLRRAKEAALLVNDHLHGLQPGKANLKTKQQKSKETKKLKKLATTIESEKLPQQKVKPDPNRSPEIAGILLELSAARAIDAFGGKDQNGDVLNYARTLLGNWDLGEFDVPERAAVARTKLWEYIPVWHGLKLAQQISDVQADKAVSNGLAMKQNELAGKIKEILTKLEGEAGLKEPESMVKWFNEK